MSSIKCPNPKCGAELDAEAKFCPMCGTKIERVHDCGQQLTGEERFCPKCGMAIAPISGQAESKEAAEEPSYPSPTFEQPSIGTTPVRTPQGDKTAPIDLVDPHSDKVKLLSRIVSVLRGAPPQALMQLEPKRIASAFNDLVRIQNDRDLIDLPQDDQGKGAWLLWAISFDYVNRLIQRGMQHLLPNVEKYPASIKVWMHFTAIQASEFEKQGLPPDEINQKLAGMVQMLFKDFITETGMNFFEWHALEYAKSGTDEGLEDLAHGVCQWIREQFYVVFWSVEQKKKFLADEKIRLDFGYYPEAVKKSAETVHHNLQRAMKKVELNYAPGKLLLRETLLGTVHPLGMKSVTDAAEKIARSLGMDGNPYPYVSLSPYQEQQLENILHLGLTRAAGEDVLDFLLERRGFYQKKAEEYHHWLNQEAAALGAFDITNARRFYEIGTLFGSATWTLTSMCNIHGSVVRPDYSLLPYVPVPMLTVEGLRDLMMKDDKEEALAWFPVDASVDVLFHKVSMANQPNK